MRIGPLLACALVFTGGTSLAEPTETEIPNLVAEVAELRTTAGVTRLAVRYLNGGGQETATARFEADKVVLVDVASKRKHVPKSAAEEKLNHLLTVVRSRPNAQVAIEGNSESDHQANRRVEIRITGA